ncbi:MAG: DUF3791 domain-containing protein [Deltaproteobacteria bacterium]|jgi:hypothetical protein|nr:DUF3791 domain-containing protein [Deltaproteobacteria bacterium]
MTANKTLLQRKYARVVEAFAHKKGISLREAFDRFYNSLTYLEMRDGISDMHCRSDEYLADELCLEMTESCPNK